ncbi:MAG TPA: sigma-54-dependent Fis family transcriptional regulator [Desulfonatronum sp.]|nr:sigma-54-dependent Fis family transcriptional regulator [Desulfonatronum sp.]
MSPFAPVVLVIDDEPGHRLMVRAVLEDAGWRVLEAGDGASGLFRCNGPDQLDAVLLDMRLPDQEGMSVLSQIKAIHPQLPVIMFTAFGSVGSAVEAMKMGAFDYLTKPADNEELKAVLEKARNYVALVRENRELRRVLGEDDGRPRLIGHGPAMRHVLNLIEQVGPTEATVLVLGESGTGKELVVKAIHAASERKNGPLIQVNCAALPGELLESELFGYVKGAFTGAVGNKPGRFQMAEKGTLLLDEIGDMPLPLQAKLLRALQERTVEPLGGIHPVHVDVRIIAATHQDLPKLVADGTFREDLFFRLNVLEIKLPPLRERLDDLPLLTRHLLHKLSLKNRKPIRDVSPSFLEALTKYHWPGNVRELENVLERALILTRSDTLSPEALPQQVLQGHVKTTAAETPRTPGASFEDAERSVLENALAAHQGHRGKTAEALGISRRTLQYKLTKHGLTTR